MQTAQLPSGGPSASTFAVGAIACVVLGALWEVAPSLGRPLAAVVVVGLVLSSYKSLGI